MDYSKTDFSQILLFLSLCLIFCLLSGMSFNELDHSLGGEVLPRFRLRVNANQDLILDFIDLQAKQSEEFTHTRASQYLILKIPPSKRDFWSPELQIQPFHDYDDKDKTLLRCVVGPSQSVWMMFAFFYSAIIMLTLFGGMFGLVQYQLNKQSVFLWMWPVGVVAFLSIFAVAKFGQMKARSQTLRLVSFVMHQLETRWEVERVP